MARSSSAATVSTLASPLILNILRDCGSDAATGMIRAPPEAQLRAVRGKLEYYGLGDAAFPDRFSLERASFESGPVMDTRRGFCFDVMPPGDREALVVGG